MTTRRWRKRGIIVGAILLVLLGAVGFLLWRYLQPIHTDTPPDSTAVVAQPNPDPEPQPDIVDPYVGWKTYTSQRDGYELKYPSEWIVINETTYDGPYIRNMEFTGGGYPEGYINLRILRDEGAVSGSDLTPEDWYAKLGVETVKKGPVTFTPDTVEQYTFNDENAKKAKSIFTETDEDIFLLHKGNLYEVNMYPYGVSENTEVKKILASFRFI